MLEAALRYAAKGWRVFPLAPRSKAPLLSEERGGHGFHDATTDVLKIRAWWAGEPVANVAVATGAISGIDVLDVDPKNGGSSSLDALLGEYGPLPETLTAGSGSGGLHFYFRHAAGLRRRIGFRPGLDALCDGGYVVVPHSVHPNGRSYTWRRGVGAIAHWPLWLLSIARETRPTAAPSGSFRSTPIPAGLATAYGRAALNRAGLALAETTPGQRNFRLNATAYSLGRLVAGGHLASEDVEARLLEAADRNGYVAEAGEAGVRRVIASGLAAGVAAGPRGPSLPWAEPGAVR